MPGPPPRLVGRNAELAQLRALLDGGASLVAVTGPPGVGTSALAEAARHAAPISWRVELADAHDADAIVRRTASAIGARGDVGPALAAHGPALLVLDNADAAATAIDEIARRWLAVAPELAVLVARRTPGDAIHVALGPLRGPAAGEPLAASPAGELFLARWRARSGQPLLDAARADATALVELCGGLPAALELAAEAAAGAGIAALRDALAAEPAAGDDDQPGALHRATAAAWHRLAPWLGDALAAAAVLPDGFSVGRFTAVVGGALAPRGKSALDALAALRDAALIRVVDDAGPSYAIARSARRLGRAQLIATGRDAAARERLARHLTERVEAAARAIPGHDEDRAFAWLDRDRDAVIATIDDGLAAADPAHAALALRALLALDSIPPTFEVQPDLVARLDRAVAVAPPALLPRVLAARGGRSWRLGRVAEADADLARALELAPADPEIERAVHRARVQAWTTAGRLAEARASLDRLRALAVDEPQWRAVTELTATRHARERGDAEAAGAHAERAREAFHALGSERGEAATALELAFARVEAGAPTEARALAAQVAAARPHDAGHLAQAALADGLAADRSGDATAGLAALATATELARSVGLVWIMALATADAAAIRFDRGERAWARELLATAVAQLAGCGRARDAALYRAMLGVLEAGLGDRAGGAARVRAARAELAALGRRDGEDPIATAIALAGAFAYEPTPGAIPPLPPRPGALAVTLPVWAMQRAITAARRRADVARTGERVRAARSGAWFELRGERVDLADRPALRRLVGALLVGGGRPGHPVLAPAVLVAATWPADRGPVDAMRARLDAAIARLRDLGLRDTVVTADAGYRIDPAVGVELVD